MLAPLRAHLAAKGEDPALLSKLHFIPSEGIAAYRMKEDGDVNRLAPVYNLGFSPKAWGEFSQTGFGGDAGKMATRQFLRGGYISLHFANRDDLQDAKRSLEADLKDFEPAVEVVQKLASDEQKHVLHIKLASASKAIGREYVLRTVADEIRRETGERVARDQILVAGDRMGTSAGQKDDASMFIFGATNMALGSEAMPGADRSCLNGGHEAFGKVLHRMRRAHEARANGWQ